MKCCLDGVFQHDPDHGPALHGALAMTHWDVSPHSPERGSTGERLRRRNALWAALRAAEPGSPAFEATLAELAVLVRWPRERVLAGLGLGADEAPPGPPDG